MRRTGWLLLILICLWAGGSALGEAVAYPFHQEGVRLYLPGDWEAFTPENLLEKADQIAALGTTAQALAADYAATGTLLEAFPQAGGQIRFGRHALPDGFAAQDAYAMTPTQKDAFLAHMTAQGYGQGAWSPDLPEFALLGQSGRLGGLPTETICYATVRYGAVYTVSSQVIGRPADAADEEAVRKAASALLFLGAKATPAPDESAQPPRATLDVSPTPAPDPAQVNMQREDTPLAMDEVPSVSRTSHLTLTGTTLPNTPMRYYINGAGYERFESDDQGRFSVLVRKLPKAGKNVIAVHAIGEGGYGIASFTVVLDQARTPCAVTPILEGVAGLQALVTGSVLPGTQVEVIHRTKTYQAEVLEDGSFSCQVTLPKVGENAFTVRAALAGYLRQDTAIAITRLKSEADEQAAFLKKAKAIAYDKLLSKPASYKDAPASFQGRVVALFGAGGQPLAVIALKGSESPVAVLCEDLLGLELGDQATALCTLTGQLRQVNIGGQEISIPEARLNWLLPSPEAGLN